eukprot:m51a1_g2671 hypothetical protein (240) ;mRNA; f:716626-718055
MSVPYETAVNELCEMFPDFDREVVVMILRENRGHMERTIDTLFVMKGEKPINDPAPAGAAVGPDGPAAGTQEQIDADEMLAREIQRQLAEAETRTGSDYIDNYFFGGSRPVAQGQQGEYDDDVLKDLKEKWNRLGNATKLKCRELWLKLKTKTGDDGRKFMPINEAAPAGQADDEEIAFDASLVKRTKPALEFEGEIPLADRRAQRTSPVVAPAQAPSLMDAPVPQAPSSGPRESKKDK